MNPDAGTAFGTWQDRTSRLLYADAMPALLSGVPRDGLTLDLGGANGLSRQWFNNVLTVDVDASKQPDVVADALTYTPDPPVDRVLLRYVLHYLSDAKVRQLARHVATYADELVVVQFVNDDLRAKRANSVNETKHFRSEVMLLGLLRPWRVHQRIALAYDVDPQFYANRLGHPSPSGHPETVVGYLCRRTAP